MSKSSTIWECQSCGSQSPVWSGQCPECGKWNALVETIVSTKFKSQNSNSQIKFKTQNSKLSKPQSLSEILKNVTASQRISTGIGELDRVLGSGMVPGSVMLLAGEPGMGKSTLLSQVVLKLKNSLYVCGEESPSQVVMRLRRLAKPKSHPEKRAASDEGLFQNDISLFAETNVDLVIDAIQNTQNTQITGKSDNQKVRQSDHQSFPSFLVVIDSIQTLHTDDLSGMAGSVGQIRECAGRLSQIAKNLNISLFLIGHITKEGEIAGPKVLEHMVDVVLTLEGDRTGNLRFVRAVKNRFGPVDEVGLFSMDENGMNEVLNPAELLIGEQAGQAQGSVLGCVMEGQRPLTIEVQALTVPSKIPIPRRIGHGIRIQKLQLLCAVIEKHLGLGIGDKDVYVNVAGGLSSQDPGLDLAIVAAIVSSLASRHSESSATKNPATKRSDTNIFCGEVGLLGEIRNVSGWPRREKEIKRLKIGKLIGKNDIRHIRELQKYLQ